MHERRKTYTIVFPNNQAPVAVPIPLSFGDSSDIDLEVWNAGGIPPAAAGVNTAGIWLLRDRLDTPTAAGIILGAAAVGGIVDCICCVPRAGVARVSLDEEVRNITAFLEVTNTSGMSQALGVTVIECVRDRVSFVDSR